MNDTLRRLTITAPSRLHFGLLSFNNPQQPQFGGVGMMIRDPALTLVVTPNRTFGCSGRHADRVAQFSKQWQAYHQLPQLPACHLHVVNAAPQHVGLGLGTQLAMSVASALTRWSFGTDEDAIVLAASVGRGQRSAIGTHGFAHGGFLFEQGKHQENDISDLTTRRTVPDDWRVVLFRPNRSCGLHGDAENITFDAIDPVPASVTQQLIQEVQGEMLPALDETDFRRFAESVTRYGRTAGLCFRQVQGGPYASRQIQELVDRLLAIGCLGVGQSSWGPTVFALAEDDEAARFLVSEIVNRYGFPIDKTTVTTVANEGAHINLIHAADHLEP